jgi:arylsulfatase A-like enzyme
MSHYDIAPTILYLQGLDIPNDWDGHVLTEIFEPEYVERHPVEHTEMVAANAPPPSAELAARDVELIEARLRGLGYIE